VGLTTERRTTETLLYLDSLYPGIRYIRVRYKRFLLYQVDKIGMLRTTSLKSFERGTSVKKRQRSTGILLGGDKPYYCEQHF